MRNWGNKLFLMLTLVATAAVATPPRSAWITDRLFAENDDVILILRDFGENQGSHFVTQTDTFLLTVSRADGTLIDIAPVERVVDVDLGETDIDTTTFTPLANAVNPYEVRATLNAAPLNDPIGANEYRSAMWHTNGLLVFEGETPSHSIDHMALRRQITESVNQTRTILPMLDGFPTDDLLDLTTLQIRQDCTADRTYTQWHSSAQTAALVRLSCTNYNTEETMIFWVTVPVLEGR